MCGINYRGEDCATTGKTGHEEGMGPWALKSLFMIGHRSPVVLCSVPYSHHGFPTSSCT